MREKNVDTHELRSGCGGNCGRVMENGRLTSSDPVIPNRKCAEGVFSMPKAEKDRSSHCVNTCKLLAPMYLRFDPSFTPALTAKSTDSFPGVRPESIAFSGEMGCEGSNTGFLCDGEVVEIEEWAACKGIARIVCSIANNW